MTCLLLERYRHFQGAPERGLIFLPCELIERNGHQLRDLVLRLAAEWRCEPGFGEWVTTHCHFLNTLVDRIVPGHPEAEMDALTAELGWQDPLLVVTESFYQWVIEGPEHLRGELPFAEAGLSVIWTSDLAPYRERKVRVLNGAHTLMALTGCLAGVGTVSDAMKRPPLRRLVEQAISEEILPTLKTDTRETAAYAGAVLSRFANPFIQHQLLSISLNSVAKWRVRILPTLKDHHRLRGGYPPTLVFSLAALLRFYRGTQAEGQWQGRRDDGSPYPLRDTAEALELLSREWAATPHDPGALTARVLGRTALWGEDLNALPDLAPMVARHLERLQQQGLQHALATVLGC
jgi:tagaturonate reductase